MRPENKKKPFKFKRFKNKFKRFKNDYINRSFQIESMSYYKLPYKPSKYESNPAQNTIISYFFKGVLCKNIVNDIKKYEHLS